MGLIDILSGALNALAMPVQAVGNLFSSVTGASDAFKTMTGRGDTSAMSQAKNMADYQMENQKNLMTYGNDLQVAQWNRENAYNSPGAQMSRLQSAGLNPLFHGLDGNSSGGLSAVSAPSAPDLGSLLNAAGSSMSASMDRLLTGANIALANSQRQKLDAETKNIEEDTKTKVAFNKVAADTYVAQLKGTQAQTRLYISQSELNNENKKVASEQVKTLDKQREVYDQEIAKMVAEVKSIDEDVKAKAIDNFFRKSNHELQQALTRANISKTAVDTLVSYASLQQIKAYVMTLYKQQDLMQSQIDLNAANESVANLQGTSLRIQNGIAGLTFNLLEDYGPTEKVVGIAKDLLIGLGAVAAGAAGAIKAYKSGLPGNSLNGYSGSASGPAVYQ